MKNKNVNINEFEGELLKILQKESKKLKDNVNEIVKTNVNLSLVDIKNKSPKRRPEYSTTWEKKIKLDNNEVQGRIYNAKNYRLTHLLEFGHKLANGTKTKPIPHILRNQKKFIKKTIKELKQLYDN